MSTSILELSEHELYFLPPGTPAVGEATRVEVEIRGEKFWITARLELSGRLDRLDQYRVFWRPDGLEDSRVFASQITVAGGPDSAFDALGRIHHCIDMGSVRLWRAPDAAFGVEVSTENYGHIELRRGGRRVGMETFSWEHRWTNHEFASLLQAEFLQLLQSNYDNKNSSLWPVLRWCELTDDEKNGVAFGCQNGNWQQLNRLFACAQIAIYGECGPFSYLMDGRWLKPAHKGAKPVFQAHEAAWLWFFDEPLQVSQPSSVERKWRARWRDALCQIVRPNFWPDEPIYNLNWRRTHYNYGSCRVECRMPTAHEARQAQLELREFLRPHLSQAEIEALFVPDAM